MSVESDIFEWSSDKPNWQRDILRRLMLGEEIDEAALDDLVKMCKAETGWLYAPGDVVEPRVLDSTHLRTHETTSLPVSLLEISNVKNVNAISSDRPLRMRGRGLTIIYGPNGSGKTGYVRILRRVCGPRASNKDILPNIFSPCSDGATSATLKAKIGDDEKEIRWPSEAEADSTLRNITVFDSESASTYVNEQNEVVYAPSGLNVLDRLAQLCLRIKERIENELSQLGRQLPNMPIGYASTAEHRWLDNLTADTADPEIMDYSNFDTTMERELANITSALAEPDPMAKADALDFEIGKLRRLQHKLEEIHGALDANSLSELRRLKTEMIAAEAASRFAATSLKDSSILDGIGSRTWQLLWEAARRFSVEHAYPGQAYPVVNPGAQCVLCQQPLSESAGKRMQTLEDFAIDVTSRKRDEAKSEYDAALQRFRDCARLEADHLQTIEELRANYPRAFRWINTFAELCGRR